MAGLSDVEVLGSPAPALRRARISTDWIDKALVVAAFVVFFGTFKTILLDSGDSRTGGSALYQLVTSAIYLASMALVVARGFPVWGVKLLTRGWPLVLLSILPLISTAWSDDPGTTARRAIALLLSMWFAYFVVLRFTPRGFFNLLVIAFAVFLVVSILAVAVPGQGITGGGTYSGAWRGLTGNKNEFGRTVALAVALLPAAALAGLTDRPRRALMIGALACPVLVLSHSATSLVAAVAGLAFGTAIFVLCGGRVGRYRLRAELRVVVSIIAVVSGLVLFTIAWTPLLQALGRDPTLTGRTKLWGWALAQLDGRQILGAGYRAFWINHNTRYFFVSFAWHQTGNGHLSDSFSGPTHSHSGYVDLLVDLGYVGLSTFIVTVLSGFVILHRVIRRGGAAIGFIFAVILAFLLVYAVTARSILQQGEDLWVLFAVLYLYSIKESLFLDDGFKRTDVRAGA